jgi:putative flippase GtrA
MTILVVGRRAAIFQAPPPAARHMDVEEADVRPRLERLLHRVSGVRCFRADDQTALGERTAHVVARGARDPASGWSALRVVHNDGGRAGELELDCGTGRTGRRFCLVGASGYAVNLAVYAALLVAGLQYLAAGTISFIVAAASNYAWNRTWTFRTSGGPLLGQGARALLVSGLSLGANQLFLLALVAAGAGHVAAQAFAILLVTPFSFTANKIWAFAGPEPLVGEPQAIPVQAPLRSR